MELTKINTVIVGAGVVGMALARELALRGDEVVVLEAESTIGSVISARNSGVIHAGLYYKPGSLKARFCVEGRDMLYAYSKQAGFWTQNCGKLVVATSKDEIADLHALKLNAETNGVRDMRLLSSSEAREMEPQLVCAEALHVPVSGMIDVHGLLNALWGDADNHGAMLQTNSKLVSAEILPSGEFLLTIEGPQDATYNIQCARLINCAGLSAQKVAAALQGYNQTLIPEQVLGKGNYFCLQGAPVPFSRLIYPLPTPGTLGLHYHSDINNRAVFGPDLEIVDTIDYRVNPARLDFFFESIRKYWPTIKKENLVPDYTGIRPKLKGHNDFIIQTEAEHHIPGLIQCYGIESPGVTSCLALGKFIADCLKA